MVEFGPSIYNALLCLKQLAPHGPLIKYGQPFFVELVGDILWFVILITSLIMTLFIVSAAHHSAPLQLLTTT